MPWGDSHLHCLGQQRPGEPTLLLQSGLDIYGAISWTSIHNELSRSRRVCAYDRAGIMWSAPNDNVRDGYTIADELHALLETAGETPPYVVVGHSRGGLLSIVYAGRYPRSVEGLVLIDSSHFDQARRLASNTSSSERPAPPTWLVRLLAGSGWLRLFDPYPYGPLPPYMMAAKQFMPISINAFVAELSASERLFEQAAKTTLSPMLPLLVLSRGEEDHRASQPDALSAVAAWRELQADLAGLTECGEVRTIEGAGHYVHHDQPDAVIQEIESFLEGIAANRVCNAFQVSLRGDL